MIPSKAQDLMDDFVRNPKKYTLGDVELLMEHGATLAENCYHGLPNSELKRLLVYATDFQLDDNYNGPPYNLDFLRRVSEPFVRILGINRESKEHIAIMVCLYFGKYCPRYPMDGYFYKGLMAELSYCFNRAESDNNELFWKHFRFPIKNGKDGMLYAPISHLSFYATVVDGIPISGYPDVIASIYNKISNVNTLDKLGNNVVDLMYQKVPDVLVDQLPVLPGRKGFHCFIYEKHDFKSFIEGSLRVPVSDVFDSSDLVFGTYNHGSKLSETIDLDETIPIYNHSALLQGWAASETNEALYNNISLEERGHWINKAFSTMNTGRIKSFLIFCSTALGFLWYMRDDIGAYISGLESIKYDEHQSMMSRG